MKSEIHIVDTAEQCCIDIEGSIGVPEEQQFDDPDTRIATYDKFREALQRIADVQAPEVIVNIRSTGGDVNDALLIHDALRSLKARIVTRCYGYTASAATIIAQAASEGCREISANSLYLIHNAVCLSEGNADEMAAQVDLLRQTDARIAEVYAARSGGEAARFEALMRENNGTGRWLSPEEAIAFGLADRIIEATDRPASRQPENRSRGWRRLLAAIGVLPGTQPDEAAAATESGTGSETPAPPRTETRNVWHSDLRPHDAATARSVISASERRASFGPTRTLQREDPSCGEALRSANERAYAEDAKRFSHN